MLIFQKENSEPVMFGELKDIAEADRISCYLNKHNIRNMKVVIPKPDFENLRCFTHLIKKTIVSECHITSEFMFSGHFRKFCRILDADGISLKIDDFNVNSANAARRGRGHEYYKNILSSPLENIAEIYSLLGGNDDLKNGAAEEIANLGYDIEYVE